MLVDKDGQNVGEVKRKLILKQKTMTNLDRTVKDKDISMTAEIRLAKGMVFPEVMYSLESWALEKKSERKKIDAFELWI